jgi:hypothetical protein
MRNYWSSRLSEIVAVLIAMSPVFSYGQFSPPEEKFPKGETYLYPVKPGQPGSLAGTMGELRSTHFHSGIDIRTDNKIGYSVLASKSGYISRVTVSPGGYGNVIYITHPDDGNTTLYAHLDKFKGKVARFVLEEQYRQKSNAIDLFFKEGEFTVKRGDTIALSGNSGSSGGPHLHFDIRDPDNYALNPLQVTGFPEIVDDQAPTIEKIALKTLDINSRINDKFGRFEFYAQRVGNNYIFSSPILAAGNIGVEILAKDKLAAKSPFYGGVNYIEMAVNDKTIFNQSIDKINIAETRGIYTLMDFKTMRVTGNRFYKLYIDDGNDLDFYEKSPSQGKITVKGSSDTNVKVTLKDTYGNASNVSFSLKPSPVSNEVKLLQPMKTDLEYDLVDNTIMISTRPCIDTSIAMVYFRSGKKETAPAYFNPGRAVYLLDLRKGIPDSIFVCGQSVIPNIKAVIPPGPAYNYYSDRLDIEFPEGAVYDTVYMTTFHTTTSDTIEVFNIGTRTIPLNKAIQVTFRPFHNIEWDKTYAVYRVAGKGYSYLGGGWENGGVHFATREFGDFVILRDLIAPTIKPIAVNNYVARFKIRDNLSGIDKIEAQINGTWLLMHFDPKTAVIWSEQLDKSKPLKGEFKLLITDNAGNETTFTKIIP